METKIQEKQKIIKSVQNELKNLYDCVDGIGRILPSGNIQKQNPLHFLAIYTRIIDVLRDYCILSKDEHIIKAYNELVAIKNEDIVIEDILRSTPEDAYDKMMNIYKDIERTTSVIL